MTTVFYAFIMRWIFLHTVQVQMTRLRSLLGPSLRVSHSIVRPHSLALGCHGKLCIWPRSVGEITPCPHTAAWSKRFAFNTCLGSASSYAVRFDTWQCNHVRPISETNWHLMRKSVIELIESLRGRSSSYGPGPVLERWAMKQPWRHFSLTMINPHVVRL